MMHNISPLFCSSSPPAIPPSTAARNMFHTPQPYMSSRPRSVEDTHPPRPSYNDFERRGASISHLRPYHPYCSPVLEARRPGSSSSTHSQPLSERHKVSYLLNPVDDDDDYSSTSSRAYTSASASASPEIPWCRPQSSFRPTHDVPRRSSTISPASSVHSRISPICTRSPTPDVDQESPWRKYMTGTCQKAVCRYPVKKGDAMVECGYKGRTHATKRHIETIHFDIKRHECGMCGKLFSQKASLERHENTHTGLKPYECPYINCGESFGDRARLHRHKVLVHQHLPRQTAPRQKPHLRE